MKAQLRDEQSVSQRGSFKPRSRDWQSDFQGWEGGLWPPRLWPASWRALGILATGFAVLTLLWSAFGKLLIQVLDRTGLIDIDQSISTWFEDQRTETLTDISWWVSVTGDSFPKTIIMWTIAIGIVTFLRRLDLAVFLIVTLELERLIFGTTAGFVGRLRPPVEQLDASAMNHSFPSGHVASSTTFYFALALIAWAVSDSRCVHRIAVALAAAGTALMIVLRLYRGMHYLSDTLFGVALGFASLVVGVSALVQAKRDLGRRRDRSRIS